MLQAMLAERFQLKFHRENREAAVYALVVGKGGSKLKDSLPDTDLPTGDLPKGTITLGAGDNQVRVNNRPGGATVTSAQNGTTKISVQPGGQMRMEVSKMTMAAFAQALTPFVDRPVVDMTDLNGNYQVSLDFAMDNLLSIARTAGIAIPAGAAGLVGPGGAAVASDPTGGSIFASVQELGLKLDPRKAPVESIVIDHLEKMPTEN